MYIHFRFKNKRGETTNSLLRNALCKLYKGFISIRPKLYIDYNHYVTLTRNLSRYIRNVGITTYKK